MAPIPQCADEPSVSALARKRHALTVRAALLGAMRRAFERLGFMEVETPVRLRAPALEPYIDAEPSGGAYLRTSPELHMKRLLCAGYDRIYQIGPCFRRGERGARHAPEYTMLEWYASAMNYSEMLDLCKTLLVDTIRDATGSTRIAGIGHPIEMNSDWRVLSVREFFLAQVGWDPCAAFDQDRFDRDLVETIEPEIAKSPAPVALIDYPVETAALARCRAGAPPVAERWELYLGGMELANAFGELTNPAVHRQRFSDWADLRSGGQRTVYPPDTAFLAALENGLPECSGVALGVDRLVMAVTGLARIDEVRAFVPDINP